MAAVLPNTIRSKTVVGAGEPGRIADLPVLNVFAQLGLLRLVLRQFQIAGAAFLRLWLLALAGFTVHALLPLRLRLPFFLVLPLAGIALVLGLANAAWLVAVGLVLILICHIPSFVATSNFGSISTNHWGMRDQDFQLQPLQPSK